MGVRRVADERAAEFAWRPPRERRKRIFPTAGRRHNSIIARAVAHTMSNSDTSNKRTEAGGWGRRTRDTAEEGGGPRT